MQPLWPLDCCIIATMATQTQQCSVSMFGSLGGHSLLSSATSSMRFAIRSFDHIWLLCRLVFIAFMLHHFGHLEACHSGSHSLFHRSKCQLIRQWAHLATGLEAPEMKHPRPMTRLKATTWKKTPRPMTRMELLWMVPPVPMASGSTPWMGHGCQGHLPFWTWPSMWSHQQVTGAWLAAGQAASPGFFWRRLDWGHSRSVGFVANHGSNHSMTLAHIGTNEWPCFLDMLHAMFHHGFGHSMRNSRKISNKSNWKNIYIFIHTYISIYIYKFCFVGQITYVCMYVLNIWKLFR